MDSADHIAALERSGDRLAAVAEAAPLDAPVPTCPDWDLRDLVRHQGGVHRWATTVVATPYREFPNLDLPDVVGEWPSDDQLLPWFRAGHQALVDALRAAPDDLACWAFLAAPSPKAMWARRQAHETTIHCVDAELAAGTAGAPIDPVLAADGVDELLSCFITRRGSRLRSEVGSTLGVRTTDVDDRWLVAIAADGVTTTRGATEAATCTVSGPATDVYLALWSRGDAGALTVDGDRSALELFLDTVHIRWS